MVTARSTEAILPCPILPRGAAFGRYLIVDCVGAGAMGVVYEAYDLQLTRKVALKLASDLVRSGEGTSQSHVRLLREAQSMARLSHPNVVAVFDAGILEDRVFIAMEFVGGLTLRQWLAKRPRSVAEILDVFVQAGRGLSAAHRAGLVHRDFKPDNVLVDGGGRVRVADFGLARPALGQVEPISPGPCAGDNTDGRAAAVRTPDLARTWPSPIDTGSVVGTPAYMAPEQIAGREADHRSDQFSFCAALFEALYGVLPFEGHSASAVAFSIAMGRVRRIPSEPPVPPWIGPILRRGLAVRPEHRHSSIDALIANLSSRPSRESRRLTVASVLLAAAAGAASYAAFTDRFSRPAHAFCVGDPLQRQKPWEEGQRPPIEASVLPTSLSTPWTRHENDCPRRLAVAPRPPKPTPLRGSRHQMFHDPARVTFPTLRRNATAASSSVTERPRRR